MAMLAFVGLRWTLQHQTQRDLIANTHLIELPPQQATVVISWP